MLFSLHVNSSFSCLFLWLISSFMPSWSEKMLEIIYILLNLLALTLCTSVWSVLEKGNAHLKRMCITGLPLLLCCFACSVQLLSHVWLFATPWTACSAPGLPVHHQLPEFIQTHVHWVGDAIQPSHPLLSPSLPALKSFPASGSFQMSLELFASSGQIIGISASTSVLPMNTQDWSLLGWTGWVPL